MAWVVAAWLASVWWVGRDAYRTGRKQGRLDLQLEQMEAVAARAEAERGEHLRVVK